MEKILIKNVKIILEDKTSCEGQLLVDSGKIDKIFCSGSAPDREDLIGSRVIDGRGLYLSPGFIEIHVHGGGGSEVNEGKLSSIENICNSHARFGTTGILPTVFSDSIPAMIKAVHSIREASEKADSWKGAAILGAHLEGPYFAMSQRGAQSPDAIKDPTPEEYLPLLDSWDGIKMMGVAPELPGVEELAGELMKRGIVATIAHSDANYDQVLEAVKWGFSDVTHIYSGCSIVHRINGYRFAGVVESGLLLDELTVQVIADGRHLPASLLKLIYKNKGPEQIALITDALSYSGAELEEGTIYTQANGIDCLYEDGVMKLTDRQAFAGSVATSNLLVKNMRDLAEVPLEESVYMASYVPARILNMHDKKGSIAPGKDADLVLFDEDLDVYMTMVEGQLVYSKEDFFE